MPAVYLPTCIPMKHWEIHGIIIHVLMLYYASSRSKPDVFSLDFPWIPSPNHPCIPHELPFITLYDHGLWINHGNLTLAWRH